MTDEIKDIEEHAISYKEAGFFSDSDWEMIKGFITQGNVDAVRTKIDSSIWENKFAGVVDEVWALVGDGNQYDYPAQVMRWLKQNVENIQGWSSQLMSMPLDDRERDLVIAINTIFNEVNKESQKQK